MTNASAISPRALTIDIVPQTWIQYYNGPMAGFIDLNTAGREYPSVFGETRSQSVASVVIANAAQNE